MLNTYGSSGTVMATPEQRLAWQRMKGDFVALWNARAAQADEGARGNFVFAMLLGEMLRLANNVAGYEMFGRVDRKYWEVMQVLMGIPGLRSGAFELLEKSVFGFNGPVAGRCMDGPECPGHLVEVFKAPHVYVDLRQLFKALVEAVDPLMEGSADGV